jgi:hypothetical protein
MARVNVVQPNGMNAIFNTVTDEFVEFNTDVREFADSITWEDALRYAIGAGMQISSGVHRAIALGLVSLEHCEKILQAEKEEFDA